jgi:hypothetical protein
MSGDGDRAEKPGRKALGGVARAVARIAGDLFTLEVTTIVQEHIPAMKMPPPMDALHDIGRMYDQKLSAMHAGPADAPATGKNNGGMPAFDAMRDRAMTMMQGMEAAGGGSSGEGAAPAPDTSTSGDMAILQRIAGNSQELMKLSQKMERGAAAPGGSADTAELELNPEELMRLHLIWHMGVEEVAMKTTIYVTGDVITRIRPEFLREDGRALVEIHQSAIRTAVDFWKTLTDVLSGLVGSLGQFILPDRNRAA